MISKSELTFSLIYERICLFFSSSCEDEKSFRAKKEIILSQNNVKRILRIFRLSSSVKFLVLTTVLCSISCNFLIALTFRQSTQAVIISN
jgi:hypothetical protein